MAPVWFVGFAHAETPLLGLVGSELAPDDAGQLFALIDVIGAPPQLREQVIVASLSAHSAAVFALGEEANAIAMFSEMMQLAAADIVGDTAHAIALARHSHPGTLAPAPAVKPLPGEYMELRFPRGDRRDWATMPAHRRARTLWGIHERDRAVAVLETACLTSLDALDHFHLGELFALELNQPAQALPYLRRAAELVPDRSEPYTTLGIALAMVGDLDGAIAAAKRATEIAPEDPRAWANLAVTYDSKRDVAGMRAAAARAQELEPGEPLTADLLRRE